jgi:hypothetical protein
MRITKEISLLDHDAWSGAVDTKETIIEHGKVRDFDFLMEDLYPDGMTETELNDILWFETDWIYDSLGIDDY